jgi:hypothetical protein
MIPVQAKNGAIFNWEDVSAYLVEDDVAVVYLKSGMRFELTEKVSDAQEKLTRLADTIQSHIAGGVQIVFGDPPEAQHSIRPARWTVSEMTTLLRDDATIYAYVRAWDSPDDLVINLYVEDSVSEDERDLVRSIAEELTGGQVRVLTYVPSLTRLSYYDWESS